MSTRRLEELIAGMRDEQLRDTYRAARKYRLRPFIGVKEMVLLRRAMQDRGLMRKL